MGRAAHGVSVLVDLTLDGVVLPGVYVVGDELGEEVVVGRNALNKLVVVLDGPRRMAHVGNPGERLWP